MIKCRKVDYREIGLEIGLIFARYFLKADHLHYGYWTDDLDVDLHNLPQAQENHSHFIMSHIPEGITTILDVGCGAGSFARKLIENGYHVDCVSPSPILTHNTRELLGNKSNIFECSFEKLKTEKRYDVIVFSESFQYIPVEKALQNSFNYLNDGGCLLICDFFQKGVEGKSAIGGGHKLSEFYDRISRYPFILVKDIDITKETAPNLMIVHDFLNNVGLPVWNSALCFLKQNYPKFSRFLQWKYRKKIEKINRKYFSDERNAENFAYFKSYRLLLYKKTGSDKGSGI